MFFRTVNQTNGFCRLDKSFGQAFSKACTDPTPWGVGRRSQATKFLKRRFFLQAFSLRLLFAKKKRLWSFCYLTGNDTSLKNKKHPVSAFGSRAFFRTVNQTNVFCRLDKSFGQAFSLRLLFAKKKRLWSFCYLTGNDTSLKNKKTPRLRFWKQGVFSLLCIKRSCRRI